MLRYDVWSYWEQTSKSSTFVDPDLKELRQGWRDPVIKENIMYSGHVHAMAGMFGVLFDDDRFEQPGGLSFEIAPVFASGKETFAYDLTSLDEVIYWQMVESGFLGIACEPNMVFLVCNQFPMLGFRFHDLRKGTRRADEVTQAYDAAWRRKGWITNDDFFAFYFIKQDAIVGAQNSYPAAVMNAWNREFVHGIYPRQLENAFDEVKPGMLLPCPRAITGEFLDRFVKPDSAVGLSALWLSEMGDEERLSKLLKYADTFQNPTWEAGGLFYPRCDALYDEDGHFIHVDPWVGNALIAYSRLNVADGLHELYSRPWSADHFAEPNLSDVSPYVDVLRAGYLAGSNALVVTIQTDASAGNRAARMSFANIAQGSGKWVLEWCGRKVLTGTGEGVEFASIDVSALFVDGELTVSADVLGPTDFVLRVNQ
jgi:hypothetical protein